MTVVDLTAQAWPAVPLGCLTLVPVGSTEQHGPHLPFTTDAVIADAVCRAAAPVIAKEGIRPVAIAPVQAFGSSGEHQSFPGTISIGHEALRILLVELVRSLSTWSSRTLFVNAHGGNVTTLVSVIEQMRHENHVVDWVPCALETPSDLHAGLDETAVMLHIARESVDMDAAVVGVLDPLDQLLPRLMAEGMRPVTETGILGDPTSATEELGAELFRQLVDRVVEIGLA